MNVAADFRKLECLLRVPRNIFQLSNLLEAVGPNYVRCSQRSVEFDSHMFQVLLRRLFHILLSFLKRHKRPATSVSELAADADIFK